MKTIKALLPFLLLLALLSSCNKNKLDQKTVETNKWIWEEMDLWYLWTRYMPQYNETDIDPTTYFNSLLYDSKDKWSFITENYRDLVNSFQGIEVAMGYSLALYYKDNENVDVVGYVEFVYPNTPASRAGIKRGDIIGSVNNETLNTDNYIDLLFYTNEQTLGFLEFDGTAYNELTKTESLTAELIDENPVIMDTVYTSGDKKIGYLVYVGFISNFNNKLDEVFGRFKEAQITDLIVDLRYNPGGDLGAANYLCSSIAPESEVQNQKRLVNFNWNNDVQNFLIENDYTDNLYINMNNNTAVNLSLQNVYFLTTGGTASASELTIVGLKPYMNVITLGETTHGKYTASVTFPDKDSVWALQPIVLKYSNANGVTDFEDGFTPDYVVADYIGYPLGNTKDPVLAKAMGVITGVAESKSAHMQPHINGKYMISAGRNPVIQKGVLKINRFNLK